MNDPTIKTNLIGPREVMKRTGIADSTLRFWMRRGLLPEPIALAGSRQVVWPLADLPAIERQIANLKAQREKGRQKDCAAA